MKKRINKIILSLVIIFAMLEFGALFGETYIYCKYKVVRLNVNSKIVAKMDNIINFSGMASR